MVRAGETADPPVRAPAAMRPVLRFKRLSRVASETVVRALEDDPELRARVAEAATEAEVGRAGMLWLTRPPGWADDPVFAAPTGGAGVATASREDRRLQRAEHAVARHREEAEAARAAQRRASEELAVARRRLVDAEAEATELRHRADTLDEERNEAVRALKAIEAQLVDTRRDLNVAREATRQAEAELLAHRRGGADDLPSTDAPGVPAAPGTPPFDREGVREAVAAAASAAADLAASLSGTAAALAGSADAPSAPPRSRTDPSPGGGGAARGRPRRVRPTLPPATLEGSLDADRHLVGSPQNLVIVDGYNVARTAWPGLTPEEERRRTVGLLEELAARSRGTVVVVFDGDDGAVAPPASRSVRVRFSDTGTTADAEIAELLAAQPPSQPAVVVSSDREVADDATRQGAAAVPSDRFLAATRG